MIKINDLKSITDLVDSNSQIIPIVSTDGDLPESNKELPEVLPILTLRSSVLFPGAITPITVGREKSMQLVKDAQKNKSIIGAVMQRESMVENPSPEDMYSIGTAASILKIFEMPSGNLTVILQGLRKFEVMEYISVEPYYKATVSSMKDTPVPKKREDEFKDLVDTIKQTALQIIELSPSMPQEAQFAIKNIDSSHGIINFICSNIEFSDFDRQMLLEEKGLFERAQRLLELLVLEQHSLEVKNEIHAKVRSVMDNQQREYFLQQQMRTIQDELGEGEDSELNELAARAEAKNWTKKAKEVFEKELSKLDRLNPAMAEYSVQLNYLETMLSLPWNDKTEDNLDLQRAQDCLDTDHYGLDDVKDRILEHLAVLKLKGDLKSPILCLYGAPGVGKTSLGKSVASALGRKFGRISLGGMHDESEIRGHRKTYVGAMPGRIIQTINRAGSSNPVVILDEIDKISASSHGDPSSALLEVLDPEQNSTFHDNYLDIEYDLSSVLFIATANNVSNIPSALRDRMEMINVSGYLTEEKVEIAFKHLVKKQAAAHGLKKSNMRLSRKVLEFIVENYTRESGVRTLDKLLAKVARYIAKEIAFGGVFLGTISLSRVEEILGKPRYRRDKQDDKECVGVVTGLAWTEVGGEILSIESVLTPGKGQLNLTGNLGNVMKESAAIALGWVKSAAESLKINTELFTSKDINIHIPEGAIPKDGPSAGITMATALVSTYTGRAVRARFAMTGEITLRGKVLPVGGVKEKILAARRAGVTDLILSELNEKDILEIKASYLDGLTFHFVKTIKDVLKLTLV
ncbi:MAG: endopeptidase La [Rikenellaceae bacterium]